MIWRNEKIHCHLIREVAPWLFSADYWIPPHISNCLPRQRHCFTCCKFSGDLIAPLLTESVRLKRRFPVPARSLCGRLRSYRNRGSLSWRMKAFSVRGHNHEPGHGDLLGCLGTPNHPAINGRRKPPTRISTGAYSTPLAGLQVSNMDHWEGFRVLAVSFSTPVDPFFPISRCRLYTTPTLPPTTANQKPTEYRGRVNPSGETLRNWYGLHWITRGQHDQQRH